MVVHRYLLLCCSLCLLPLVLGISLEVGEAREYELMIVGPDEAFEGEEIQFLATLNNQPIQAKVLFGDIYSGITNASTGNISFIAPKVPFSGTVFQVTAWVVGNVSAECSIFVKNMTGTLEVSFSQKQISEFDEFTITVVAHDEPIEGAQVWFDSDLYFSDETGTVWMQAPDVLVTTNMGFYVNKTGYGSYLSSIRVFEQQRGVQLMEVFIPSIVAPTQKNISVEVHGLYGSIANVSLEVWYEDVLINSYVTDSMGKTLISAPSKIHSDYFILRVKKTGYKTLSGAQDIQVRLYSPSTAPDLFLTVDPSELYEGESFVTMVTNEDGVGVSGVNIWIGGTATEFITGSSGIIAVRAPVVFFDQEQYIYAVLDGYNPAETQVTIRNKPADSKILQMNVPTTVMSAESFEIFITNEKTQPIEDVTIRFQDYTTTTNDTGKAKCVAPTVTISELIVINASRDGFMPVSMMVKVIPETYQPDNSSQLHIGLVPHVFEQDSFMVTVKNDMGIIIPGAQVVFQETTYYTDYTGTVSITAPDVAWDMCFPVVASQVGYRSTTAEIMVKNQESFTYWYLIGFIITVLLVGSISFYWHRNKF